MHRDELLVRAVEILRSDERVLAIFLAGSLGRGDGDEFSDVDLLIAVAERGRDDFVDEWSELAASIAPIVLEQRIGGTGTVIFSQVTDEWVRFDATVVTPPGLAEYAAAGLRVLFDRADLASTLAPAESLAETDSTASSALALTREFMRVLGLLPIILGRDEYVVGASGAGLLRGLVIRLMLLATPSRGGALRLDGVLPADRLAALATLPPIEATYDSVLAVHLACARVFLPLARSLVGEGWPVPIERALHGHLSRTLGVDLAAVERDTSRTGTGTGNGGGSGSGSGSGRS